MFLSAHDRSYRGLERFGHTPGGKTRKGTPDLLKTLDDGRQLAVQCSTEKSYWNKPGNAGKLLHKLETVYEIWMIVWKNSKTRSKLCCVAIRRFRQITLMLRPIF